ncbi:pentapeptide repeat-containing protein [Streptomyces sp. NPDC093097]|uniref:pentapeptide repeat-containing protein n=1 Tax=Streptomyces sp. NPDC093097 TaxID=3366027 RepID=UPI003826BAAE
MDTLAFGRVTLTLPGLDEPGLYLSNVQTLVSSRGVVQDFQYADAQLRSLELDNTRLITGRIAHLRTAQSRLDEVRLNSVEFDSVDLGSAQWTNSKLSRVVFRNCKIMGGALAGLTVEDVLFENCKLDYSTFEKIRTAGPVMFSKCSLVEAEFHDCDLSGTVFSDCVLRMTEFGKGRYKETDLRGNDLSSIRGLTNLTKVRIDPGQQADLAQALVAELDINLGDG